jgi:transcriptional regulator with XRE-family HTH domain
VLPGPATTCTGLPGDVATRPRGNAARGWSQKEVARQMKAYGYDFHQTMIATFEAAQRPIRVRELADLAALYGVEFTS